MISVIYGSVLVMMITFAYLIASEVLLPGNMILVAVSVAAAKHVPAVTVIIIMIAQISAPSFFIPVHPPILFFYAVSADP